MVLQKYFYYFTLSVKAQSTRFFQCHFAVFGSRLKRCYCYNFRSKLIGCSGFTFIYLYCCLFRVLCFGVSRSASFEPTCHVVFRVGMQVREFARMNMAVKPSVGDEDRAICYDGLMLMM